MKKFFFHARASRALERERWIRGWGRVIRSHRRDIRVLSVAGDRLPVSRRMCSPIFGSRPRRGLSWLRRVQPLAISRGSPRIAAIKPGASRNCREWKREESAASLFSFFDKLQTVTARALISTLARVSWRNELHSTPFRSRGFSPSRMCEYLATWDSFGIASDCDDSALSRENNNPGSN